MTDSPYLNEAGQPVPRTTEITGKYKYFGGLLKWNYDQGFEAGIAAARGAKGPEFNEARDRAGHTGTLLHRLIDEHIAGKAWEPPEGIRWEDHDKALELFGMFKQWWPSQGLRPIATETSLVSEEHQYGGTLDLVAKDANQNLVLIDWKTTRDYNQDMYLQMAAYRHLWRERKAEDLIIAYLLLFSKDKHRIKRYPVTGEQMDLAFPKFLLLRKCYGMEDALSQAIKETRNAADTYVYRNR
jgi:hypothetical protein